MASLSYFTGKLYTEAERNLDIAQSVADRALTLPGTQSWRPAYGCLSSRLNRVDIDIVRQSINEIMINGPLKDPRIDSVQFRTIGTSLFCYVNDVISVGV